MRVMDHTAVERGRRRGEENSLRDLCSHVAIAGFIGRFCNRGRKVNFYCRIQKH